MVKDYLAKLNLELGSGMAREHAYRPALKNLVESVSQIVAVNDPSRSEHGNPDFTLLRKNNQKIIVGYAETKDITSDLDIFENSNQLKRYLGYSNLILTNYLEFRFFRNGIKYQTITIAKSHGAALASLDENYPV